MPKLERRHLWLLALAISLVLPAAVAAGAADCATPYFVWELELDTLEKLAGPGDVEAERAALGESAELTGSSPYVQLHGPEDTERSWGYALESAP